MAKVKKVELKVEGEAVTASEIPAGLLKLIKARIVADEEKREAKRISKDLGAKIREMMAASRIKKVTGVDGFCAYRAKGSTASKLDKDLLMKAGVTVKQIEVATIPGSEYEYLQVRKEEKDEDDDS